MKKNFVKRILREFYGELDKNYTEHEVMRLSIETCINKEKELFARIQATVEVPGKKMKTFLVTKDFDIKVSLPKKSKLQPLHNQSKTP